MEAKRTGISEYLNELVFYTGIRNSSSRIKIMRAELEKAILLCKEKDANLASTLLDIDSLLEKMEIEVIEIGSR